MTKIVVGNGVTDTITASAPNTNFVLGGGTLSIVHAVGDPGYGITEPIHVKRITVDGTAAAPDAGAVLPVAYGDFNLTMDKGVALDHGTLSFSSHGTVYTFDGDSQVADGSNLSVWGGRYFGDSATLNGSLDVSNHSTAEFYGPMKGGGTVNIDPTSIVNTQATVAGLRFNVDGLLNVNTTAVTGPFLATIKEGDTGVVDIYHGPGFANMATVVDAVLHTKSNILDLDGANGVPVMSLQFANSDKTLYATADGHGGLDITTHQLAGSLPTMIVHS